MAASIEARNAFKKFPRSNSSQYPTGPIGCFYPSPFISSIERAMERVALALRGKRGSMDPIFMIHGFLGVVPELTLAAAGVLNSVRAKLSVQRTVPVTVFA